MQRSADLMPDELWERYGDLECDLKSALLAGAWPRPEGCPAFGSKTAINHMLVEIANLQPGMKVGRDVLNLNAAVLLPTGTLLTPELLTRLNSWGVEAVHIAEEGGAAESGGVQLAPELLKAAQEEVTERFKHVTDSTPAVAVIREMAIRRTAVRLRKSSNAGARA
jgi:hypothetical protein